MVKECKEKILKAYKENSEICEIVQTKEYDDTEEKKIEFIQISKRQPSKRQPIPKDCLIKPSSIYCDSIWLNFGREVAFGEINYFIKQISENKDVERLKIKGENFIEIFDEIKSAVDDLKGKGYEPSVIFIPLKYNRGGIESGKISFNDGRFLKIGNETNLKVILSSNLTPFNDFIVLDKKDIIWTYKPDKDTKKRLLIDVNEYEEDKTKVDLLVRTEVSLRITDPRGIKIFEKEEIEEDER